MSGIHCRAFSSVASSFLTYGGEQLQAGIALWIALGSKSLCILSVLISRPIYKHHDSFAGVCPSLTVSLLSIGPATRAQNTVVKSFVTCHRNVSYDNERACNRLSYLPVIEQCRMTSFMTVINAINIANVNEEHKRTHFRNLPRRKIKQGH